MAASRKISVRKVKAGACEILRLRLGEICNSAGQGVNWTCPAFVHPLSC